MRVAIPRRKPRQRDRIILADDLTAARVRIGVGMDPDGNREIFGGHPRRPFGGDVDKAAAPIEARRVSVVAAVQAGCTLRSALHGLTPCRSRPEASSAVPVSFHQPINPGSAACAATTLPVTIVMAKTPCKTTAVPDIE